LEEIDHQAFLRERKRKRERERERERKKEKKREKVPGLGPSDSFSRPGEVAEPALKL